MVGDSQPPRVAKAASTSNNTTAPRVVRATKQIHQRITRSNTPMPTVMEVEKPPVEETEEQKRQQLVSQPIPLPPPRRQTKVRKMNGMWIGSKRNNVKVASRKRITKLINAQADIDRKATVTMQKQKISKSIPNSRENPQLQFFAPNPKGSAP